MTEERWMPNDDMHPAMNIYGRKWRTVDGSMSGVWDPMMPIPHKAYAKGIEWGTGVQVGHCPPPGRPNLWGLLRAMFTKRTA